ncbi:unnamed protein product [Notodromas monacha]|uniref:Uncharacterized protein n=1 Tax=Notodromas monacha TaxID=399045 RepID=A0A7R9GHK3_9CRUS|nr:unnamed protein product [Notodromas monacha]CAG0923003.1 unnamed protein product [Notodromas monacha]
MLGSSSECVGFARSCADWIRGFAWWASASIAFLILGTCSCCFCLCGCCGLLCHIRGKSSALIDDHHPRNNPAHLEASISTEPETNKRRALRISSGIEEPVNIQWELLGFLALAWVIAYFIIYKGLHNSGKIIWVTALFPYFVLTILLVRAVTLPGAADGLLFYVTPDFEILKTPTPWIDAGSQVFYSYGLAIGTLFALGSYNRFNNDCIKQDIWRPGVDAIIVGCINSGTSLYAGVVTFSVLGYMAHEKQVEVKDVVDSGPGLAFLVYPEVVSKLPGAPAWAVLFFLMFCTLGIDTLFCCVEGFITALVDAFPKFAKKRSQLTIVCCIVFFVCEIPMVTYFIFVFYFVNYAPVTYGDYNYPTWAQVMGILMALSSMVCIPGYAIYYVFSQDCSPKEAFFRGLRPPQEIRPRGEVKSFALKR